MNVYLIRQHHVCLYGEVLDSAVVVADSVLSAKRQLLSHLNNREDIQWDATMWAITRLGSNAKKPPDEFGNVVCMNVLSKLSLPPGNYGLKKNG